MLSVGIREHSEIKQSVTKLTEEVSADPMHHDCSFFLLLTEISSPER